MRKEIDYLLCTVDGIPMENQMGKIPTVQNTQQWMDNERRKQQYNEDLLSLVREIKR